MKEIVLKLYEFDELSKDSQERIIERERWNIMDCCMEAYGDDYISTMKSFGDLTNTEAYGWEVGYTRYDFRFKFKYNDPICCHPWAGYVARCQRWKDSQAKKEALIFEKRRKEKEDRKKKFEEQIEMWKSGKILELYLHYYLEDDQPNVWLRIKNGIIETSKNIKIGRAEAERLWKLIKFFHNGSKFQHDMVLDTTGHKWKINSYKNDILVTGCHRIAYSEMEGVARQLGWD